MKSKYEVTLGVQDMNASYLIYYVDIKYDGKYVQSLFVCDHELRKVMYDLNKGIYSPDEIQERLEGGCYDS